MNAIRERLGPFPVWVWLLIITIAGLGWWLIANRKGTAGTTDSSGADTGGVPDVIVQNQVEPATAPGAPPGQSTTPTPAPPVGNPQPSEPTGGSGAVKIAGKTYYLHDDPKNGKPYLSLNGKKVGTLSGSGGSGTVKIGGKTYYVHAHPKSGGPAYATAQEGKRPITTGSRLPGKGPVDPLPKRPGGKHPASR